ncbi:MAG: PIN domain-containing protein [Myxococcales bacterium]|nr:PIN domain-containing protein [Myxococcales bacterium]
MSGWLLDTNLATLLFDAKKMLRAPEATRRAREVVTVHGRLPISAVTLFELRRGVRALVLRGKGARKAAELESWILRAEVLGLDEARFTGWTLAADLWARGRAFEPARVFSDADLMIAATALRHDRTLVTSEARLAELLGAVGYASSVEVVPFA